MGSGLSAYRPADEIEPAVRDQFDLPDPMGELTLSQAMTLALAKNPRLRAYGWDVRRAEAQILQAALSPNPELDVEFENFGGTDEYAGTRALETTISLAQAFPLGGDIQRRRELAGYRAQLAGWDYEAARMEVLTQVAQHYVEVLVAQQRVDVAREATQLAQQLQETTRRRIEAGDAPPIELARTSVTVATARVDLRRAQRMMNLAKRQLALTWGADAATFAGLAGTLDELQAPPPPEQIVGLINQNPEVARWAAEIGMRRAEARLAEAEAIPDLTGRIGFRHDREAGANGLLVGISLPLPIFDRRQGDVLAARMGAQSARQRQREAELRLESLLSTAYARLADAYDEATALREEALPPAKEAVDLTRRAFEQGDVALIDVLDAERTFVELRLRLVAALAAYHTSVNEIEGLIGQSLMATIDSQEQSGD